MYICSIIHKLFFYFIFFLFFWLLFLLIWLIALDMSRSRFSHLLQQFTPAITSGLKVNQKQSPRVNQRREVQHMTGVTVPLRQKEGEV